MWSGITCAKREPGKGTENSARHRAENRTDNRGDNRANNRPLPRMRRQQAFDATGKTNLGAYTRGFFDFATQLGREK
jgi:hypothetical protein